MKRYILFLLASVFMLGTNAQVTSSDPIAPIAAQSAKVLNVGKDVTSVSSPGLYDRVEMARTANKGELTLVVVPCRVDGYFFGADAKRYVVKRLRQYYLGPNNYEYTYLKTELTEMEDDEDFLPNKYYLVCPTVQTGKIVACEAGLTCEVGTEQKSLFNGRAIMAIPSEDVDNDGDVDKADVEGAVRFILQKNTDGLVLDAADADNDGSVKSNDIVRLVNAILSGSWCEKIPDTKK